jgi:hypothetical protein
MMDTDTSRAQRRPLTGHIRFIPCRSSGQTLAHLVGRLLAIGRELDDPSGIGTSLYYLGCLAANEAFFAYTEEKLCQDDGKRAASMFRESRVLFRAEEGVASAALAHGRDPVSTCCTKRLLMPV